MNKEYLLEGVLVDRDNGNWLIFLLLSILAIYVITRLLFPKYWRRFQQALIYPIEANKLLEERNTNLFQVALLLNLLGLVSIGSFIFSSDLLNSKPSPGLANFFPFVFITLIGIGLTLIKYYGTIILGLLFKNVELAIRYNHIWLIHLKIFGFIILLWTIILNFIPEGLSLLPWWGGIATLITMLIMNNIRGYLLLRHSGISLLYGILYLCTLEILPILMIIRLINI